MIAILKDLVEQIISPSMTVLYGRDDFNNLEDDATLPACYIDPLNWVWKPSRSGNKTKVYSVRMAFMNKSELDFDYSDTSDLDREKTHAKIFAETDGYADTFLNLLENSSYINNFVEDSSNINGEHGINIFDINVSGTILTFDIAIQNTDSIC